MMAVLPKQGVETAAKDVAAVAVHHCWGRVGCGVCVQAAVAAKPSAVDVLLREA